MNAHFRETLAHIQEAESVAAVAVVDTDGMLVAGMPESSEEMENLAASAATTYSFLSALGTEMEMGAPQQAIVEYSEGLLLLAPLDAATFMMVLAESGAPLGQVRLVLRRYRPELLEALGVSAPAEPLVAGAES